MKYCKKKTSVESKRHPLSTGNRTSIHGLATILLHAVARKKLKARQTPYGKIKEKGR